MPTRSASSLAIPIPSYEEATGFETPPNRTDTIEPGISEASASSVIVIENGREENEEESDENSQILMNIPLRAAQSPSTRSGSSSSSSSSSRSRFNPCKGRLRKTVIGAVLVTLYVVVLFFSHTPILNWLQPANVDSTNTRIFLIVAFFSPAVALFCVLRFGEDWWRE